MQAHTRQQIQFFILTLFACFWMYIIWQTSSIPGQRIPGGPVTKDIVSPIIHLFEYFVLGSLFAFARISSQSIFPRGISRAIFLVLGIGFAVLDEFHQSFVPDREMSFVDMLVDAVGLVIGWATVFRLRRVWYNEQRD